MELNTQFFEIGDLIAQIKKGKLVLPEFQRNFEWDPSEIADLMRTIVRKWPAGTLLFLKAEGELLLAPRAIELAPDPVAPAYYILDGQQRLTSIFHAFEEQGDDVYYIRLGDVLESGGFEDDQLVYEKKAKFYKKYPSIEKKAADRILELGGIRDDVRFGDWCDRIPQERRSEFRGLRSGLLSGLTNYRLPALVLDREVPLQAIAKIFETINKTGVQLGFLDLMIAKLYPLDFRLRDRVTQACETHPVLKRFTITGEEILQLIALREHFRLQAERAQRLAAGEKNVPAVKVKGIRKGDMLSLDAGSIVANWDVAVKDYANALSFLQQRCGVVGSAFLPSEAMVIPLADALSVAAPREGFARDLEKWVWCSVFSQTYSQGANTQAVKDARELRSWRESAGSPPTTIRAFSKDSIVNELLLESRKRNEMALRGLISLLALRDARDWMTGELIRDCLPDRIDIHHVFPDNYLKKRGVTIADKLVNFTPLLRETNIKLRDIPPSEVLKRTDIQQHTLVGHRIPPEPLATNMNANFDEARRVLLAELISQAVS